MLPNVLGPTQDHTADPVLAAEAPLALFGPWLLLARVSTASRKELRAHVDTALQPHLWREEVQHIYQLSKAPHVLDKGKEGEKARKALGWSTVYAPNTKRELGVLAREGDVQVLFINASASQRDLGKDQNSLIVIVEELILAEAFRGRDPHAPADHRPQILAPYADRLIRDHELAWTLFNAGRKAYAVFRVADKDPLDTLSNDAESKWMFYAWESATGKSNTVSRLTNGALNHYRAGLHGGSESQLLRGYRWEHEPMPDGTWRRSCDANAKTALEHYPEPDPESWWEVETIMRIAGDAKVKTWRELARRLGLAGIGSRGADERGVPLHELSDPASSAKQLLSPRKLDAYVTGRYLYEQIGPGHGMWSLPGGHRFKPRWPGDENGHIEYPVELGRPAWPVGFSARDVERIKRKWWPEGKAKKSARGSRGTDNRRRALAGLIAWSDETHRYEVFAHSGRYELRTQDLADARRRGDGELGDMRHEDSELVASWLEGELSAHVAHLIDQAVESFLATHPTAELATSIPSKETTAAPRNDPQRRRDREVAGLVEAAHRADTKASGASELANELYGEGDRAGGRQKHNESVEWKQKAEELRARATTLANEPLPQAPAHGEAVQAIDVATPAALVTALRGPYGSGAQPSELNAALEGHLGAGNNLKISTVPGSTVTARLAAEVRLTLSDGTTVQVPAELTVPAKIAAASAEDRIHELAEQHMWHGKSLAELATLGRSESPDVLRRQIREYVGAGVRRPDPDPATRTALPFTKQGARIPDAGLRSAILAAPVEARRVIWADQTGVALPRGLPSGFAEHIRSRYLGDPSAGRSPEPWSGDWARPQLMRYRALAVLDSHPALRLSGMRADHLAACIGSSVRDVNDISRIWTHKKRQDPPTLARLGTWNEETGPNLLPDEKLVAPIRCAQRSGRKQCRGLVVAVLFCPEVLATRQGALCVECRRAPGANQEFPVSYVAEALERLDAHHGSWVQCGFDACTIDFGAGPGLMWRFDDDSAAPEVWHGPDCRAGRAPMQPMPRTRACADPVCVMDEGYGPGLIVNNGRSTRRWHSQQCQEAAQAAEQAQSRQARACGFNECAVDEGHGPGLMKPASRRSRRWHDWRCQRQAARARAGDPPDGMVWWSDCGDTTCIVDEGGGPGRVRHTVGATGRRRRYHDKSCAKRAHRT